MHAHHDPDHFYDKVIMPYKGQLEEWYVQNQNLLTYMMLIALTIWVILFSKSNLVWTLFTSLPDPPDELRKYFKPKSSKFI